GMMANAMDLPISSRVEDDYSIQLREVIEQKKQQFFYQYRTQNGEYVFGGRKDWAGGRTLQSELTEISPTAYRLDTLVWKASLTHSGEIMEEVKKVVQRVPEPQPEVGNPPSTEQFILQDGYEIELFASEL